MRKALTLISAIIFYSLRLPAQANPEPLSKAGELFTAGDYGAAVTLFLQELKKDEQNALLNYKTGVCYMHSRSQKHKAIPYLEKAVDLSAPYFKNPASHNGVPGEAIRLLADAYYHEHRFDKAIATYEKYKTHLIETKGADKNAEQNIDSRLELCRYGKELHSKVAIPVSSSSGSPCAAELRTFEYTCVPTSDKKNLLYTFKVPLEAQAGTAPDSRYFEGPYVPGKKDSLPAKTTKESKPKSGERDTILYAGTVGTSIDGQVILTYKNEQGPAGVYLSRLQSNRWSPPVKLRQPANTAGWEPNECVSSDGKLLYFTSDRPGGYGGNDIYRCTRLPNGEWSKAMNLGPDINSSADEEAPFIHPDGQTLFFSSNRIKPASYDIFTSTLSKAGWGKVVNVGYPVNRDDKDIFQVTADTRKLYASSKKNAPNIDSTENAVTKTKAASRPVTAGNFLVTILDQNKTPLTLMSGQVLAEEGQNPVAAVITVRDNYKGDVISTYRSDPATGNYALPVPTGKNCNITFEAPGRLFGSQNAMVKPEGGFTQKDTVRLPPYAEGSRTRLNNVFLTHDQRSVDAISSTELLQVKSLLDSDPYLEVEIAWTIITKEEKRANRKLADQKAGIVAEALKKIGVDKDRISSNGYVKSPPKEKKEKKKDRKKKEAEANKQAKKQKENSSPAELLELHITKLKKK